MSLNANTAGYCFLDFDLDNHRAKLATAAAFVDATDSRYGFSSKDLRVLGGSEIARINDLMASDHEWSGREAEVRPPLAGNRVVLQLFWDVAPLACQNFATLCANGSLLPGEKRAQPVPIGESGKPLTYRKSTVHRVIPNFIIQGGDFVFGNGSGGESIFGKKFKDERAGLALKHDRRGILSMGNSGKNSNTSQFFITLDAAPQCDGKHVIFGQVVCGWAVLDAMEKSGTREGTPSKNITITDCGVWTPLQTPASGYWYDSPDAESYSGISPVFMVRPRVAILAPTVAVAEKFGSILQNNCDVTTVSQDDDDSETRIVGFLEQFKVDVVIVAPACKEIVENISLPNCWTPIDSTITASQVVRIAKPMDAKSAISKSWLALRPTWQLDGMMQ